MYPNIADYEDYQEYIRIQAMIQRDLRELVATSKESK